jgi:hypothetical protein
VRAWYAADCSANGWLGSGPSPAEAPTLRVEGNHAPHGVQHHDADR